MKFQDLRSFTPKPILFHYTSQKGLIGIIKDRVLWASKIHYMNDSKEFSTALELARAEIRNRLVQQQEGSLRVQLEGLLYAIDTIEGIHICVCSFSEAEDSLSQWRAYSDNGCGFSIGFATDRLVKMADEQGFRLQKCVYDTNDQIELVQELIDRTLSYANNCDDPETVVFTAGGNFAFALAKLAPLIKHEAFADEKEWRLVGGPFSVHKLDHRTGKSMVTPFFRLGLSSEMPMDCIAEVIVGPTPHPELSRASVQSLLFSQGLNPNAVKVTKIPFRNW